MSLFDQIMLMLVYINVTLLMLTLLVVFPNFRSIEKKFFFLSDTIPVKVRQTT